MHIRLPRNPGEVQRLPEAMCSRMLLSVMHYSPVEADCDNIVVTVLCLFGSRPFSHREDVPSESIALEDYFSHRRSKKSGIERPEY